MLWSYKLERRSKKGRVHEKNVRTADKCHPVLGWAGLDWGAYTAFITGYDSEMGTA